MNEDASPRSQVVMYCAMALAFVAMLTLLYNMGKPVLPPFSTQTSFDHLTVADSDGNTTAIIDNSGRELLILNDRDELVRVMSLDTAEVAVDEYIDVCVSHDKIYVAGVSHQADSDFVRAERVLRYNANGTFDRELYYRDHQSKDIYWPLPEITDISPAKDGVYMQLVNTNAVLAGDYSLVSLYHLPDAGEPRQVRQLQLPAGVEDLGYAEGPDALVALTRYGEAYLTKGGGQAQLISEESLLTSVCITPDGTCYGFDDSFAGVIDLVTDQALELAETNIVQINGITASGNVLTLFDRSKANVIIRDCDNNTERTLTTIRYAPNVLGATWGFWLSASYLALFVLALIGGWIWRSVHEGVAEGMGSKFAALAMVAGLLIAGALICGYSLSSAYNTRLNELNMLRDQYVLDQMSDEQSQAARAETGAASAEAGAAGAASQPSQETKPVSGPRAHASLYEELEDKVRALESLRLAASLNSINIYYRLYSYNTNGKLTHLADSIDGCIAWTNAFVSDYDTIVSMAKDESVSWVNAQFGNASHGLVMYTLYKSAYEGGTLILELGSAANLLQNSFGTDMSQLILSLLVALLAVYLSYSELRADGRALIRFRRLSATSKDDAAALLTRPISFFATFLQGIDSVMMTLIGRELLKRSGMSDGLIFAPALAVGLGVVSGYLVYGRASRHMTLRGLLLVSTGWIAVVSLATIGAVSLGQFWLFCACKYLVAIPFGALYVTAYLLPRRAHDQQVREEVSNAVTSTDESAPALAAVLGGYVAQGLGDASIYLVVALACLPLVALVLWWGKDGNLPLERRDSGNSTVELVRFMRGAVPLGLVLFAVLPRAVMGGFSSLLFPVFAAGAELTKASISSLAALGQLITYLSLDTLAAAKRTFDPWRMVVIGLASAGTVFTLLVFNHTIMWSVAAIALIALSRKMCTNWKGMWLKAANHAGLPDGRGMSSGLAFEGLANASRPLLLGAFLAFGQVGSVLALAIFCLVCLAGYLVTTRRSVISPYGPRG